MSKPEDTCGKQVEYVWGGLRYATCEDHLEEITKLVDSEYVV